MLLWKTTCFIIFRLNCLIVFSFDDLHLLLHCITDWFSLIFIQLFLFFWSHFQSDWMNVCTKLSSLR
jgi:hypothetical protein